MKRNALLNPLRGKGFILPAVNVVRRNFCFPTRTTKSSSLIKVTAFDAVVVMLTFSAILFTASHVQAADGIQKTINFQGKVTNTNGTNVADGAYDFVIKIYDGAGNSATSLYTETWSNAALFSSTMSTAPSTTDDTLVYSSNTNEGTLRAGQILWNTTKKESVIITSVDTGTNTLGISRTIQNWNTTDTITNRIYVKDGVFRVAVNSLNADLSGVNFNSNSLFVGVNFNADGEMKPRMQLRSNAYAFNAEKVNGLTVTNTSDNPFSSATALKIDDGSTITFGGDFTTSGSNALTLTTSGSTSLTLPSGTTTLVAIDSTDTLTNKTIGSTGLTFSGAGTDITSAANEDLTFEANGTGDLRLVTDAGSDVILTGLTTDANGVLYANTSGVITRVAETETGSQCLLSGAGASGAPSWGACGAASSLKWNGLTTPDGTLSLAMSTHTTEFNWDTGTGTNDLFSLTTDASSNGTGALLNLQTGASSTILPLRVRAGSAEALLVNASGNVGIGTTDPAAFKLEVAGHIGPSADSTYDLGSNLVRFANGYFDTVYGDGSNLTGVAGARNVANSYTVYKDGSTYYAKSNYGGTNYSGTNLVTDVLNNVVSTLHAAGGGKVSFQHGTFDMGSDYLLLNNVNDIVFEGQGIDATIITNSSDAAADSEPFNAGGSDRITIRDLTVSAGGADRETSDAIDFDNSDEVLIERVKITDSRGRGIVFDGKDTGATADYNIVRDCIISGTFGDGIQLLAARYTLIQGCKIHTVGTSGSVTGDGIKIAKAASDAGQANKKASHNTIIGNHITEAAWHGIQIVSSDHNRIIGNTITNSGNVVTGDGIELEIANAITADYNIIEGNTVIDDQGTKTQRYGLNIKCATCNYTTVGNNNFENNASSSINDDATNTIYSSQNIGANLYTGRTGTTIGANYGTEMAAPTGVNATPAAGGSLTNGTYYFKVVAVDGAGGTTASSSQVTCTVDGSTTTRCSITWTAVPGAASYRVYKGISNLNQDRYQVVTSNAYNYDSDSGATLGAWPRIGTAYTNKLATSGNSWLANNTGMLGIGTVTPLAKLDVFSTLGTVPAASFSAQSSFAAMIVDNSGIGDLFTASSSGLSRFVITQNGNVGIGTTGPLHKFHLAGATNQTALMAINGDGHQALFTASASGTTKFLVDKAGNVGIGTTSPGALLDVNGAAIIRNSFSQIISGTTEFTINENGYISDANGNLTINDSVTMSANFDYSLAAGTGRFLHVGYTGNANAFDITVTSTQLNSKGLRVAHTGNISGTGYGVHSSVSGTSTTNIAGYFSATGATNNYAAIFENGNVGIGITNPNASLYVTRPLALGVSGKALAIFDQIEDQDILSASASGTPMFTLTRAGGIKLGSALDEGDSGECLKSGGAGAIMTWGTCGGGSSKWTADGAGFTYLTDTDDDLYIGGATSSTAAFFLDLTDGGSPASTTLSLGINESRNGILKLFSSGAGIDDPTLSVDASGNLTIQAPQSGAAVILGDGSGDISLTPGNDNIVANLAGTGDFLIQDNGTTFATFTDGGLIGIGITNPTTGKFIVADSGSALTIDAAVFSATTGTTTTGVDGLQIDFANAGSGAQTNSGLTINVTSNNTNASSILYGLNVGNLTSGGESASEIGLRIGTGWDQGIVIESGNNDGTGLVYSGTGRPTKTITLSPEYPGAVLSAFYGANTDTNITGNLTSDIETTGSNNQRTYYEWERTTDATQHFYTVAVRMKLPKDFSEWATSNAIQVSYVTESATNTVSDLDVRVYLESDSDLSTTDAESLDNASTSWTTVTIDDSDLGDWNAADEGGIIYLRMGSASSNHVRIGDIQLNYLAKF